MIINVLDIVILITCSSIVTHLPPHRCQFYLISWPGLTVFIMALERNMKHIPQKVTIACDDWWSFNWHQTMKQSSWRRHQMQTFSVLLAFCAGNSPVTGEFPTQRPVTRSFDIFFDLHLNQQLGKQWRLRWFETISRSVWRLCDANLSRSFIAHSTLYLNQRRFYLSCF